MGEHWNQLWDVDQHAWKVKRHKVLCLTCGARTWRWLGQTHWPICGHCKKRAGPIIAALPRQLAGSTLPENEEDEIGRAPEERTRDYLASTTSRSGPRRALATCPRRASDAARGTHATAWWTRSRAAGRSTPPKRAFRNALERVSPRDASRRRRACGSVRAAYARSRRACSAANCRTSTTAALDNGQAPVVRWTAIQESAVPSAKTLVVATAAPINP